MLARVKPEYEGQHHPVFGVLTAGVVYPVGNLGELFAPVTAPKAEKPKAPKEEE
jgi:hypothetical protein